jgi:hypothetical protein
MENDCEESHDCVRSEEPRVTAADRIADPFVSPDVWKAKITEQRRGRAPVEEKRQPKAENTSGTEWRTNGKERPHLEKTRHRAKEEKDVAQEIVPVDCSDGVIMETIQPSQVPLVAIDKGNDAEELWARRAGAHIRRTYRGNFLSASGFCLTKFQTNLDERVLRIGSCGKMSTRSDSMPDEHQTQKQDEKRGDVDLTRPPARRTDSPGASIRACNLTISRSSSTDVLSPWLG